ncbi:unnamed protein product, partial [Thlaspi arvense]
NFKSYIIYIKNKIIIYNSLVAPNNNNPKFTNKISKTNYREKFWTINSRKIPTMAASLASLSSSIKTGERSLFNRGSHSLTPSPLFPLGFGQTGKHITSCFRRRRYIKNISALETSDGTVNVEVDDGKEEEEACELVNRAEVSIDGVEAHLLTAVKNNNGTGLLLLSDVFGFQDSSTSDFAYRVACNGYNVLVPDLFRGNPWSNNRQESEYEEWRRGQEPDRIRKNITALTKWMVDEFAAAGVSKKLGVMGFCFGGGRVVDVLAADQSGYFSTGVSFYGTRIDSAVAGEVKVPVLFITGDRDPLCQVEGFKKIEEKIGEGSKVVVFEGRGHGFVHRPETPDDDKDAEEAFAIMRNWEYIDRKAKCSSYKWRKHRSQASTVFGGYKYVDGHALFGENSISAIGIQIVVKIFKLENENQ